MADQNDNVTSPSSASPAEGSSSNGSNVGRVEQVTGVVIDVAFPDELPEIYSALRSEIPAEESRAEQTLIC